MNPMCLLPNFCRAFALHDARESSDELSDFQVDCTLQVGLSLLIPSSDISHDFRYTSLARHAALFIPLEAWHVHIFHDARVGKVP